MFVCWSTFQLFHASLMGQNGCFVAPSFINLHHFSRTGAHIKPEHGRPGECEDRRLCASVHVCLDKCTFPLIPHFWKVTTSPDELVKPSAGRLTWLPTWPAPPGCPFISFPSCWTQQEQLGTLLVCSPPHTFPNSIFLLISMLYEHQMLPNDSLNCLSGTLDDI